MLSSEEEVEWPLGCISVVGDGGRIQQCGRCDGHQRWSIDPIQYSDAYSTVLHQNDAYRRSRCGLRCHEDPPVILV